MREPSFKQKLGMAAVSGVTGMGVVYPFDIVKTSLQTRPSSGAGFVKSVMSTAQAIISSNGVRGLWRGFTATAAGIAPEKGICFAVNDWIRDYCSSKHPGIKLSLGEEIFSGTAAGILSLSITVPYEHVKIKLQIAPSKNVSQVINEIGVMNTYRGLMATFIRDVPFFFVYFPLYFQVKTFQMSFYQTDKEPFHVGLIAGSIAGTVGGALTTPGDMVKTLIQKGNKQVSTIGTFRKVVRREGVTALFKGCGSRSIIIGASFGIISAVYELQKKLLS
mmetsp:Transcript_27825/g.28071  ORF Transcript_27825/g.28071 Transcript_27825/m.28071 type:complete len:276 (+) Transcript_27825:72-899(+)